MVRVVFLFFFFSGFSSLVFEIIWARMLQQVFGTTSFAISTLLTAFMAGLALGSYLGGKLAQRVGDQLRLYGLLEGAIGLYALVVPLLLSVLPRLYGPLFEHLVDHFYLFSLLRFGAVFLILLLPTTMMGATLPLVSQWIADRRRVFQGSLGLLYGANTLGACAGCALAGFVLLPAFGLTATNLAFAAVNGLLCLVVLTVGPRLSAMCDRRSEQGLGDEELRVVSGVAAEADHHPQWALGIVLVVFGVTGLAAMSYQVLWTRAYLITLGSSTYSFTLVLTAVLVGIALGSAAISSVVDRINRPVYWLALVQAGVAGSAAMSFVVLNRVPLWLFERIRDGVDGVTEVYLFQFGLVALVVLVPSFLQGACFPLVIRAVTAHHNQAGQKVGMAYASTTVGAIVGSFAAGFILLPWLGLQRAIVAVITLSLLSAVALALVELRLAPTAKRALGLTAACGMAALLFWSAPPIDQARLMSGVFRAQTAQTVYSDRTLERYDPEILFYRDGLTATVSVERHGETVILKANGKPEASDGADMPTQVLVGLLPFVLRAGWEDIEVGGESAAMIGFGSGVTAGASLQWPLAKLDVVEIENAMVEASRFFDHVNHRPLEDPRLRLIESDGRNFVEYSPATYDVIISEPSNPWIAGVASLFTVDFFERARSKLEPRGVFAQWVQLYEMHPDNVRTVFESFRSVFPHVVALSTRPKGTDLILLGSDAPLRFAPDGVSRGWAIDSVRLELQRVGLTTPLSAYGLLFMNGEQLAEFSAEATLNTDDNGHLEFATPRDVLQYQQGQRFFREWYFTVPDYGDPRPYLDGWPSPTRWDDDAVGALARALFDAGKPELTREILEEFTGQEIGTTAPNSLDAPLQRVRAVIALGTRDIDEELRRHWPEATPVTADQLLGLTPTQASRLLESLTGDEDFPPLLDSVRGDLLRLGLTVRARDFAAAQRMLPAIEDAGHLDHLVAFHILRARVLQVRRQYGQAFEAYLAWAVLEKDE